MASIRPTRLSLVLVLVAGGALGQDSDKPFLSGPEVEDNRPGLVEDSFGSSAMGKARMGAMTAIPAQDLRTIVASMRGDEADPSIRLSEEQYLRVRELTREHEAERRAWMSEHREELKKLYDASGLPMPTERGDRLRSGGQGEQPRRRPAPEGQEPNMMEPVSPQGARRATGQRMPGQGDVARGQTDREVDQQRQPPTPEQEAARLKLREFMQKGPSTGDLQRQIYAELTEQQQAFIDGEVLRLADERANAREQQKIDQRVKDREVPGDGEPGQARRVLGSIDWEQVLPEDGSVNLEALPEQLRARLEKAEPTQQRRLLERLRDRLGDGKGVQPPKRGE